MRKIETDRKYRHFKGNYYHVTDIAEHTETGEMFVVYKALYGEFKTYVRPYDMLSSHCAPKTHHRFKSSTFPQSSDISPTKR